MGSFKFKKSILSWKEPFKVGKLKMNIGLSWKEKNEVGNAIFAQTFVVAFTAKRDMTYD